MLLCFWSRLALGAVVCSLLAGAPAPKAALDFNRDIRPILSDRCFACHGPDDGNRKAALRLDSREGAMQRKGLIVVGKADDSRLIKRVLAHGNLRMPPVGDALSEKQVALLKDWINAGAPWKEHWAYVPPTKAAEPTVARTKWPQNAIDRFILARLEQEKIQPSPEADRATLLRRLSLDLTGLPPSPGEVAAFVADKAPNAYEKQVDRLLASPRYGERMAQMWMDLARYADTHGYHIDSHRDMWRWRDWVIRSFQENKPFDRFTVEQLAGDLLPNATPDQILATGFNRNHMINYEGGAIPEEYQNEYLVDRVDTTSTVFLGMTMGCARCHDHKYDPIKQKDFYSFAAFFNGIPEKGLDGREGNAKPYLTFPSETQKQRKEYVEQRLPQVEALLSAWNVDPLLREWERSQVGSASAVPTANADGLIAHYEMDGSLSDSSGHYRHGRATKGDVGYPQTQGVRSASFNGRTEAELGRLPWPKSLALWVRTDVNNRPNLVLKGAGWRLQFDEPVAIPRLRQSTRLRLQFLNEKGSVAREILVRQPVLRNRAMHVAVIGEQIYIDGKRMDTFEAGHRTYLPPKAEGMVTVGGTVEAERFVGSLDDVRFYDRELSPKEISILHAHQWVKPLLRVPPASRTREQWSALREYYLTRYAPAAYQEAFAERKALRQEKEDLEWETPTSMVMDEMERPRPTYLLTRGDYRNKAFEVLPSTPGVLPPLPSQGKPSRLALANWLVDARHPLTARVTVNRFWSMLFGTGIVKTTEDFGSQGDPPSHQDLLDWLASDFVANQWNVKALLKQMVMSATYRQSSKHRPELAEKDPENRLLARGPRFRLNAEAVRDNALHVSGLLKDTVGGPSVNPYQPAGLWEELAFGDVYTAQVYKQDHGDALYRRSMYTFWKRTSPPASLTVFDAPDREKCTARRPVTNTPLQALVLLNDPTYVEAARALAQRTLVEGAKENTAQRIDRAFMWVAARKPSAKERAVLLDLVNEKLADYRKNPSKAEELVAIGESKPLATLAKPELAAWTTLASVLLNLDEAVTKE